MATILIVDDRPTNREYLVTLLQYFGHRLMEASDGEEALAMAAAERPDVIISDMVMPRVDGQELVLRLRKQSELASIPVLFYTATYSVSQAKTVAGAVGAFGVLAKPSEPSAILKMVNQALGRTGETADPPSGWIEASQTPSLVERLPQEVSALEAVSYRLAALIEMSLELAAERDPERLLDGFTYMARKLIPSKYAAVILLTADGKPSHFTCSGGDAEGAELPTSAAALADLIEQRRSAGAATLSVPFEAHSALLGRLYLLDKLGGSRFTEEDTRVAATLAGQAAAAYQKVQERKRAEDHIVALNRELETRVEQLQLANQSLEAFGYSVSHDLRAPLRAVQAFSAILQEDHGAYLNADANEAINTIVTSCRKMGQLIQDLFEFSRVSSIELRKQRVDMEQLVRSLAGELDALEPGRRIEFYVHPLPPARGDPAMLRLVFLNLIANARKFTRHTAGARIEIDSKQQNGRTIYSVKDNGAGFDMQFAHKLFGVFKRLHTDEEFEGTGIGLAVVRQIVQRHGGEVWAEGVVGKGAAFYVSV